MFSVVVNHESRVSLFLREGRVAQNLGKSYLLSPSKFAIIEEELCKELGFN